MLSRTLTLLLTFLWIPILLTGCIGGGGDGGDSEDTFVTEITDDRVYTVTLLVTDNFQPANALSPITLTIIARDRTNAPLSDVEVSLSSPSDYAVFIEPKGKTGENGRFTTGLVSSVAEEFEVTATAGGMRSEPVSVTFIAPVEGIELTASETVLSDNDTTTVTVRIHEDSTGEWLPEAPFHVTVSEPAKLSDVPVTTDINGQATFTVTNDSPETVTVTVTSGKLIQTLKLYFGATLILQPESINALDTATLTALLKDSENTPIAGQEIKFNFIGENNETLMPTSTFTSENGTASVTITDLAKDGGTADVQASSGNLEAKATVTFGELLVDPRVSEVKAIVSNDRRRANGLSEITLTVIVSDVTGAPVPGVQVNLVSDSDSAFFSELTGKTEENGRFTTEITSKKPETFQVTPTGGGVQGEPVSVTFIAPVGIIELSASERVLPVNKETTITVLLRRESSYFWIDYDERAGDLLPNATFNVAISGSAVASDVPEATDVNGQATFTVTDNTAENVVITVTSGPIRQTLLLFFGATLELLPSSINTIDEAKLTALLKDGQNTPLDGQTVTFNFKNSNNETLSPNTVITGDDGTAEVTITDLAEDGGTAIVNASSGLLNAEATVNFKAFFGENRRLDAKTTATVLDINQSTTITAQITDNNDLPIEGQTVTFSVLRTDETESQADISPQTGISNNEGEVKAIVSNTQGENVIVMVQADTAEQKIPLYFGANISLSPTEADGIAGGDIPVALTATVSDIEGVGIAGIPVDIRVTSGSAFLDDFRPSTNELGRATVNVIGDSPGEVKIEAQADNLSEVSAATLTFHSNAPSSLILTDVDYPLSVNGETTITAKVKDAQGNFVKSGTPVNFTTTLGIITESVLTQDGIAHAKFSATTQAGLATITATAGVATDSLTLTIQSANVAGTIEVSKIESKEIGIIGSGVVQSTTIEFLVKDDLGNPVADGTQVDFALGKTTLGGGETITTQGDSGITATGTTHNGLVSVILKSGAVAGTIDVIATVNGTISTVAQVTIVGGLPDADHLSLAFEFLSIAGGVTFGLLDEVTAFIGDRFGNIVPDDTPVSFITEGGMIGKSIGGGAFTTTTELGQATAILQSANPTVPFLGGVPTLRGEYQCSGDFAVVFSDGTEMLCGNPGLVTIVIFTTGSESFADSNGNGKYDQNEPFDDMSEPYIDGNDNAAFDMDELYIDVNGNGQFDNGNNQFDGPGGLFENTTIWHSRRVLFSDYIAPIEVTPSTFAIPNGGSQTFTVKNIGDIYGNALVAGTKFQVTTNNGVLGGIIDIKFSDSNGRGNPNIQFTLSSNPAEEITETDNNGNEHTRKEYPPQESATITITINSPDQDGAPGSNGEETVVIEGIINVPL